MNEIILVGVIFLFGFVFLTNLNLGLNNKLLLAFSWPIACVLIVIMEIIAAQTSYPIPTLVFIFSLFMLFIIYQQRHKYLNFTKKKIVLFFMLGICFFSISAIIFKLSIVQGSFDSFELIALGRSTLKLGFRPDFGIVYSQWGVFTPMLQGLSLITGNDFFTLMSPLYFLSLLGLFYYGIEFLSEIKKLSSEKKELSTILSSLGIGILISTNFMVWQSFYVHNNLLSAIYLFIYFLGIFLGEYKDDGRPVILAILGITGFTLCRTEAPLFATVAIFLGASFLTNTETMRLFVKYIVIYLISVLSWYFLLFNMIGIGIDTLTPARVIGLMGILSMTVCITILYLNCKINNAKYPKLVRKTLLHCFDYAIPIVLLGVAVIFIGDLVYNKAQFYTNIKVTYQNIMTYGRWGSSWKIAIILLGISLFFMKTKMFRFILTYALSFYIFVMTLGLMRVPYRLCWGDSANRMLTHIFPLIMLGLVLNVILTAGKQKEQDFQ